MMQGAIDFLLGDTREAKLLRKHFVFKIVPMLNPDGVVYGNYRCSLLGVDLNRRWLNPNKHLHPTVFYAKRLFQMFSEQLEVIMYCDMHGHSMKKNVFMYACGRKGLDPEISRANILTKMIPMMLAQSNKIFSVKDTHFRLEKSKESTARIVSYRELGILNSYTLEASFYGPSHVAALSNRDPESGEPNGDSHLRPEHLQGLGRDLCKTCLYFISPVVFRRKLTEISQLLKETAGQSAAPSFMNRKKRERLQPAPPPPTHGETSDHQPSDQEEEMTSENIEEDQSPDDRGSEEHPVTQVFSAFLVDDTMLDELQSYEDDGEQHCDIEDVLKAIDEHPELAALNAPDQESDSGGSDSIGSDNDDQKLEIIGKLAEEKANSERKRSKTAEKKKLKQMQRSDSALKSKPLQIKVQRPPKPMSFSPAKLNTDSIYERKKVKDSYLFQTIQQHLDTLYTRKVYPVKTKEDSSPRLKKGRSSQSFSEDEVSYCPIKGKEFRDPSFRDVLDTEPKVKVAKTAGGYQNFSVPIRSDIGFSPSSSFIITSIHQPKESSILIPKFNYMRKPSLSMYRRTQRPTKMPPIPRSTELCQRGRAVGVCKESSRAEPSPLNTITRELDAMLTRSGFESKR